MPQDNLVEVIDVLKGRIEAQRGAIGASERQTRASLIDPLLQALGWDIGDPASVTQEYRADIGIKSNEQVDYALLRNGQAVVLLEAKSASTVLNNGDHLSQLYRYFTPSSASVGILTNGIQYRFYSDVERDNVMDTRPFLQLDITHLSASDNELLACFSKDRLKLQDAIRLSIEETYKKRIADRLISACRNPDESFVSWIMGETFEGKRTQDKREWFVGLVKEALRELCIANHPKVQLKVEETATEQETKGKQFQPPRLEEWTSLSEFQITAETQTPRAVRFFTGEEQVLSSWRQMMIQVAELLVQQGILGEGDCPLFSVRGEKWGYALVNTNPVHPNEANMRGSHKLSNGLFVAAGEGDSKEILGRVKHLLAILGQDPSQVWLKTG